MKKILLIILITLIIPITYAECFYTKENELIFEEKKSLTLTLINNDSKDLPIKILIKNINYSGVINNYFSISEEQFWLFYNSEKKININLLNYSNIKKDIYYSIIINSDNCSEKNVPLIINSGYYKQTNVTFIQKLITSSRKLLEIQKTTIFKDIYISFPLINNPLILNVPYYVLTTTFLLLTLTILLIKKLSLFLRLTLYFGSNFLFHYLTIFLFIT